MKIISTTLFLLLMLTPFTAGAQEYQRGDVNQDGAVNISDVTCLIDNLLAGVPKGDVNQDGVANISDVTSLIDYLLQGTWPDEPVTPPDDQEYVDLGLPSGTLWAKRNVGASSPEDYGDYFAWGETETKNVVYKWNTYKWCNGSENTLTKYCTKSHFGYNGFVDNKTELDLEDDAACAHYPSGRIPSYDQIVELCNYCSWQWAQRNGVNGYLVAGPNGNTIFLPAAGDRRYDSLYGAGSVGYYWTRTLSPGIPGNANAIPCNASGIQFDSGVWTDCHVFHRFRGFTVRAVRVSQN